MTKIRKLPCGLRIATESIPYVQSATIGIWVKAGAVNENDANHGISHFIEHMLFKGTETRSAKDIASDIDRIGGQINAFTSKENTCYYVRTLTSNIDKACDVLIDMLLNSQFDEKEMEKEKNVVYEEMKMVEDSPEDDVQDMMSEALFNGGSMANSILGSRECLASLSRDDLFGYVRDKYSLDHMVVAAAGNFDEDELCAMFEERLSGMQPSRIEMPYVKGADKPVFLSKKKDIEQTHICLGTKAFNMADDDRYILSVMNNIFGGSMSSRLFQNIREERGLAYSVYSFGGAYENEGLFGIAAGVAHDKAEETIGAIIDELDRLKDPDFTEDELLKSKEQMKGSLTFSQESTSSRMVSIGKSTLFLDSVREPEEVLEIIDGITMEDINRVAKLVCDINTYSGAVVSGEAYDIGELIAKASQSRH